MRFFLPVVLRVASGQRSGGGRAVHGGQEVSDLGPLGRADVLAHVHHAVHSHLGVFLDQAAGDGREGLGSPSVALRITVQGHVTFLDGQEPRAPQPLPAVVTMEGDSLVGGRREYGLGVGLPQGMTGDPTGH